MKSEKGITLISLIVYIIVMLIVVTIIGTITSYFYSNVNNEYIESKEAYKESTLDMYLINDLKNREIYLTDVSGNKLLEHDEIVESDTIKIIYNDNSNIIYALTEDGVYRNLSKIYNKDDSYDLKFRITNIVETSNTKKKIELIKTQNGIDEILKTYSIIAK